MKFGSLLFLFFIFITTAKAQVNSNDPDEMGVSIEKPNGIRIYGKVVDESTHKGVEGASVQLVAIFLDSLSGQQKDSLITGMLTRANGDFNFNELPHSNSFRVVITAVGYQPLTKDVSLNEGKQQGRSNNEGISRDLGNISLPKAVKQLSGVVITNQTPTVKLGIDRKIFSVAQSITTTGGTGLDILKNIPSVDVDVDGNITLRNNSPQIWVDGRPTILTLDQIPADNIDKIELITNPSAKFDAASTGGIINIILKKNKRMGLNGIISAGAGSADFRNANGNISLRQGKINFFANGNFNQSGGIAKGSTLRQNIDSGIVSDYFNQYSNNNILRRFTSGRFGADYFIDNRNTLTVTERIVRGKFKNNEDQNQEYLDGNKVLERYGLRNSQDVFHFKRNSTQLNYTHKFPKEDKQISSIIDYNYGSGGASSDIYNSYYNVDGTQYSAPDQSRNISSNTQNQLTFQFDFTDPITDDEKIEMGARSYTNNYLNKFDAYAIDSNMNETILPLSNNYKYKEIIDAVYFTYTNKWKKIGYQLGLRGEYSKFDGILIDSAQKFGYEYPQKLKNIWDALFPSVFLSRELKDGEELQLNYTRRIRRPNFWELNPFINIDDPLNIRQGNPQLRPEFTNSFELNYSNQIDKGNFLASLYYRNTQNDITRFTDTISAAQYQQLQNAGVDPNAILNTFINADNTKSMGAEFTLQKKLLHNLNITPSLELQYRIVKVNGTNEDLDNQGFNLEAKLNAMYEFNTITPSFWNKLSFQVNGEYHSPEVIPQGKRKDRYDVDFAIKKEFLPNDKAAITFSVNDVFNTYRYGTIYNTQTFYQESYRRRNVRSFRLTFSYKFGNPNFRLFNKNSNNNNSTNTERNGGVFSEEQ